MRAPRSFALPALLLAPLLALAGPARGDGGLCAAPPAGASQDELIARLRACFGVQNGFGKNNDAPEIALLNKIQAARVRKDPNLPQTVAEQFADYIKNHTDQTKLAPCNQTGSCTQGPGDNPQGPAYGEVRASAWPPPEKLLAISQIVGPLVQAYIAAYQASNGRGTAPDVALDGHGSVTTAAGAGAATGASGAAVNGGAVSAASPPQVQELLEARLAQETGAPVLTADSARLAAGRGDYPTALARYAPLANSDQATTDVLLGYGGAALKQGQNDVAHAMAARVLGSDPGNPSALALYHLSGGRSPALAVPQGFAASAAASAGAAAPALPAPAAGRGAPPRAAITANAQTFKLEAALNAAVAALKLGDLPKVLESTDRALALDPDNARALALRALAESRRRGFAAEALRDANRSLALSPGNPAALGARLRALAELGRYQEALADADQLLAAAPRSAEAHAGRGYALAGLGRRAEALAELRRAAELDPRWRGRLARALVLPQGADMTLLFSDEPAASEAEAPAAPLPEGAFPTRGALGAGGILLGLLAFGFAAARRSRRGPALAPAPAQGTPRPAYEVGRQIGAGGMGVVYEGMDLSLNRRVAIKRIRDDIRRDPEERARFVAEARAVARLKHPNIVEIYAIDAESDALALIFEYVDGRTLHDLLYREALDFDAALRLFRPMCAAVEHAHAAGLIHRDLKPANVMVEKTGTVKVMDFGGARRAPAAADGASRTSTVIGTPPYMAPEQEQGAVRRESDVFALAVSFYEMVARRLPFAGQGTVLSINKFEGKILPAEKEYGLPAGFDAAMARALAPEPTARPRSPSALLASLEALRPVRA